MSNTWSQPTPKWRSAISRTSAESSAMLWLMASMTTKSLPAPCILVKRRRIRSSGQAVAQQARSNVLLRADRFGHHVVVHEETVADVELRLLRDGKSVAPIRFDRAATAPIDLQPQLSASGRT